MACIFINKCRICLLNEAEHPIFEIESIDAKESIHYKLFQCFNENIEDIEGYPRNICESCYGILQTVYDFITKYKQTCRLLESTLIIKTEPSSDNVSDNNYIMQETELEIYKIETDSEWLESFDDPLWDQPLSLVEKQKPSLTELKAKLKTLTEINFKKKTTKKRKTVCKTAKLTVNKKTKPISNGKSKNLSKPKKPNEEQKQIQKDDKLLLPIPEQPLGKLCDICGKTLTDSQRLSIHRQKHLSKPKQCSKCPRILASQNYLNKHMKRVHDKKQFICDHCERRFAFKGELATHVKSVHLKTRKKSKRHCCDKCDKKFVTIKALTIHDRSAHTGLRPAECSECGARFFHEDYLKEHVRLHTGEAPFKCPICARGYAQRGNMRSHISHNHRLADLSPETIKNLKPMWFKFLKKP